MDFEYFIKADKIFWLQLLQQCYVKQVNDIWLKKTKTSKVERTFFLVQQFIFVCDTSLHCYTEKQGKRRPFKSFFSVFLYSDMALFYANLV